MFAPQRTYDQTSLSQKLSKSRPSRRSVHAVPSKSSGAPAYEPRAFDDDKTRKRSENATAHEGSDHCARKERPQKSTPLTTNANTSVKQRRLDGLHQQANQECSLCSRNLSGMALYQCHQCPDVHYCMHCNINAAELHPGHTLIYVPSTGTTGTVPSRRGADDPPEETDRRPSPTGSGTAAAQCKFCSSTNVSFICRDCSGASFCSTCANLHSVHTLAPIPTDAAGPTALDAEAPCDATSDDDGRENGGHDEDASDEDSLDAVGLDDAGLDGSPSRRSVDRDSGDGRETGGPVEDAVDELESDAVDTEIPEGSRRQGQKSSAEQPRRRSSVHLRYESFQAMQAMVEAAQRIIQSHSHSVEDRPAGSEERQRSLKPPESLLSFPIDFTTLPGSDRDSPCDEGEIASAPSRRLVAKEKRKRGRPRKWTDHDQRRLQRMKKKGWTDERISSKMGRSPSAIQQQWRKQNLSRPAAKGTR